MHYVIYFEVKFSAFIPDTNERQNMNIFLTLTWMCNLRNVFFPQSSSKSEYKDNFLFSMTSGARNRLKRLPQK